MAPLHLAAISGDVAIAQLILEKRARIDALDMTQATPLHKAAAFNHVEMVKFLIKKLVHDCVQLLHVCFGH